MAALTSPGVGITVNVSRRDSQEYLRLHQLEPYLEGIVGPDKKGEVTLAPTLTLTVTLGLTLTPTRARTLTLTRTRLSSCSMRAASPRRMAPARTWRARRGAACPGGPRPRQVARQVCAERCRRACATGAPTRNGAVRRNRV